MKRRLRTAATAVALAAAPLLLPTQAGAAPLGEVRLSQTSLGEVRLSQTSLGEVRLSQTSGTVDANPIFASATASAPCPAGFGADAMVRIGPAGGPYANVAKPLTAGGYDRAAVSAKPNRSFTMALGNVRPADGEWQVVVECYSLTEGMHPERFVTPITVSGSRWRTGRPAGGTPAPSASAPAATPSTAAPSAPPDVSGSDPAGADPRLAANDRTGSASLGNAAWIAALAGVLVVFGVVFLLTRRRPEKSR